jgi:hypothetical protein
VPPGATLLLFAVVSAISACNGNELQTLVPNSRFINKTDGALGTIVFVHGVFGAATATWTNERSGAFFPKLVSRDQAFDGYDVYVYEYPSPTLGTALSIGELAENLRLMLQTERINESPQIIWVQIPISLRISDLQVIPSHRLMPPS